MMAQAAPVVHPHESVGAPQDLHHLRRNLAMDNRYFDDPREASAPWAISIACALSAGFDNCRQRYTPGQRQALVSGTAAGRG